MAESFRTQRQIDRLEKANKADGEPNNVFNKDVEYPENRTFGQFANRRSLQFGPLRISKEGIFVNDGTVDAVEITADGFKGVDSSGDTTLKVSSSGVEGFGTAGNSLKFYDEDGGTLYGQMGYNVHPTYGPAFWWQSRGDADVYIEADSELYLISGASSGDSIFIYNQSTDSGDPLLIGSESGVSIYGDGNIIIEADDDDSGAGVAYVVGDSVALRSKANDNVFYVYNGSDYKPVTIKDNGSGDTYLKYDTSTAKTAVVETSKGYKAMYCTESPEVWFMDFCEGKRVRDKWWRFWDKKWELKPDSLFLEITVPPYIPIKTGKKGVVQLWAKRRGQENKRFVEKSKKEFEENNKFWGSSGRKGKNAG